MTSMIEWKEKLVLKLEEYREKANLTDEAMNRMNQIINEAHLLCLIYTSTSEDHQTSIAKKVDEVMKSVDKKLGNQGWITYYFSKSSDVVTLDEIWE
jgi:ElaB/YqjD/DUF883 family membrane-anchored ribosome-binding protein